MKNAILGLSLALSASQAFALDNLCVTKQKNAASFKVAQDVGVAVQGAEVIAFDYGAWTEAMAGNTGSDTVTVRIGNRITRDMVIKSFVVSAQQIGASDDCTITGVSEAE